MITVQYIDTTRFIGIPQFSPHLRGYSGCHINNRVKGCLATGAANHVPLRSYHTYHQHEIMQMLVNCEQRNNHTTFYFLFITNNLPVETCSTLFVGGVVFIFLPLVHHHFLRSLLPTYFETKLQCQINMTVVRYSSVYHCIFMII